MEKIKFKYTRTGCKGKNSADFTIKDIYKRYINTIEKNTIYDIKQVKFTSILKRFNTEILDLIVLKGYEVKLPMLGVVRVSGRKVKLKLDENGNLDTSRLPVDYKATKELWSRDLEAAKNKKLIFITNNHTDGYKYFFHWTKGRVKSISAVSFKLYRHHSRLISKVLKNREVYNNVKYNTIS